MEQIWVHVDNKKKNILVFAEGATKEILLILQNGWANSSWFFNGTYISKFKGKDYEIVATPFCLGNISADNMGKTGLNGYVYDFSDDYDAIAINDILHLHKYLMKKNGIV